jgi:hypothetical protein
MPVLIQTHGLALPDGTEALPAPTPRAVGLRGGVTKTANTPEHLIDELVGSAYSRDEHAMAITAKEDKYKSKFRRTVAKVSDMAQFMTAYKGFQASSEAADIILEEKQKLKSRASVDWIKQKQHDELHSKVVSGLMQLASGLGMSDVAKRQKNIDAGTKQLGALVGPHEASRALAEMTAWAAAVESSNPIVVQEPLSILKLDSAAKMLAEVSLQNDDVVLETRTKLHKFNHHNKLMQGTAKVVNTTLSAAMFTPTIISPAAQLLLIGFLMATGGPEEAKLLKELYLDRRIECRYKMINQEATQAVNSYNLASVTGNTVLSHFCKVSANKLAGKKVFCKVVSVDDAVDLVAHPLPSQPSPQQSSQSLSKASEKTEDVGMTQNGSSAL